MLLAIDVDAAIIHWEPQQTVSNFCGAAVGIVAATPARRPAPGPDVVAVKGLKGIGPHRYDIVLWR